ncbi:uncharacterized protein [Palaemon carinicauda]|uniref:uncharacterized protein isoform X2 n=1 Tax=Palaemon carinicauda TaxID=392227 RepID=UPI0035B616FF
MKKIISLLFLAVVNLIHCQDEEQIISITLEGVLEKLESIIDTLKMLSQETGLCLRREDLQQLTNVSAAAHQEIKTFRKEISGIISWAEKDECLEGTHRCGRLGICEDTLFSFTCSCPSGFTWDGSDCADIDECIQRRADCNSNAKCTNTFGSYSCSCNPPFEGDGRTCSCPSGFTLKGDICEDIDECAEGKGVCDPNATCKNSIGSYSCSCNEPFKGDGKTSCEFHCISPAKVIWGLGCIKHVKEAKPYRQVKAICQEEGGRLLQHFDEDQLNDVWNTFGSWGWVGIFKEKWTSDESFVPIELYEEGYESDISRLCGILGRDSFSNAVVTQRECSYRTWGYCQFQLP